MLPNGMLKAMWGVGEGLFASTDVMMRLMGSVSTTASRIKIASIGEHPGIAPHIVGGMDRYTAAATDFRMRIQMSFASVVAHTMGPQLCAFAQLLIFGQWVHRVCPVRRYVRPPYGYVVEAWRKVSLQVEWGSTVHFGR